ncbi:MAG: prepilin-type N-terminal cleavage/methylation domain-containing protein [Acidobacteriota bacterium]|nr:prepilin-type N-terminal cleavage/methylation domain-containing protein [Acidobacteriota bacterium]
MKDQEDKKNEQGFSLLELLVAVTLMIIITGAMFALMRDSVKSSHATLEMSDGQQSCRTAQEYINRDLINAGDGLNSINNIRVPQNFVQNYLTLNPITDSATPGFVNLGLITSDNDVPANTVVLGTTPALQVRSAPDLTDRISILQMDRNFVPITLAAGAINPTNGLTAVSSTDIGQFTVGEIYFISSAVGSIFATITDRQDVGTANPFLVFAASDTFGLNSVGAGSQLDVITAGGTLPTSISRMKIIHYYIDSKGLLMRRVFGVQSVGFAESVIAEHVVSLQFRYFLNLTDTNGNVVQPEVQLTTSQQQVETRQVEVSLTVETAHTLQDGQRKTISMTTSTSVRNMQFRQSLQPTAGA